MNAIQRHDPAPIQYPISSASWQPPVDATVTHEVRVVVEDNLAFHRALAAAARVAEFATVG